MKHTPAPWFIVNGEYGGIEIRSDSRCGMVEICFLDNGFNEPIESEQISNAHLISAAPELLEACKIIVDAFDSLSQSSPARNETLHINAARAAIAKATGAE